MLTTEERDLQDKSANEGNLVFIRHGGRKENRDDASEAGNAGTAAVPARDEPLEYDDGVSVADALDFAATDPTPLPEVTALGSAIVVHARSDRDPVLTRISGLRKDLGPDRIILALADDTMALSAARRLKDAGATEVVPDTLTEAELRAVAADLAAPAHLPDADRPHAEPAVPRGKIITVMPARGGIGASTVAVNLADSLLAKRGVFKKTAMNRVVVVDLDIQFGTVASMLDQEPCEFLYLLAQDGVIIDAESIDEALVELPSGLSVLAAPLQVAPLEMIAPDQITALLTQLQARFDYVVVDAPRTLVAWAGALIERSDRLLLVVDSTVPTIRQARRLLDLLQEDNQNLPVEVVMNRERRPLFMSRAIREASRVLQLPFETWLPEDRKAARAAVDRGQPVTQLAARSALGRAIGRLQKKTVAVLKSDRKAQSAAPEGR